MKIKLLPNTKRLKQLIQEHGETWELVEAEKVQCFDDMGYLIQSLDGEHIRWVQRKDFEQ